MRFFRRKKQEVQPKQVEQVMSVSIKSMPTDMSASEAAWAWRPRIIGPANGQALTVP